MGERRDARVHALKLPVLAALAILFALALGHGHSPYFAALMLAAIIRDARHHGGRPL